MDKTKTLPVHVSVHSRGTVDINEKLINVLCMTQSLSAEDDEAESCGEGWPGRPP